VVKISIRIGESDSKWILGRLARELNKRLGWPINEDKADIDLCLPYLMFDRSKAPLKVPLFTHREEAVLRKKDAFDRIASIATKSVSLSENTKKLLLWNQEGSTVIPLGSDLTKVVRFGVVGKAHSSGRKNFEWLTELSKDFHIAYRVLGEDEKSRADFYNNIDFLLVTSSVEGGPVPVLDAIAMGVPVIAPDIGWCWQYPCIKYERNSLKSLKKVLLGLNTKRTWQDVAEDYRKFLE